MERRKTILVILTATLFMVTIFAPTLLIKPASAADPDSWYTNVSGVLASDYYSLYPFNQKSLNIGFSKFGEIIDSRSTYNLGLEYDTRDPFAPPAGSSVPTDIPKNKWSQGWLINITYYHIPSGQNRNVWACALHSDLTDYGNDWIRVDDNWYGGVSGGASTESDEIPKRAGLLISNPASDTHYGGRKTNGTVTTDSIRVLYNGPRMYIARTVNHVKDWIQTSNTTGTDEPLVDVVFTFIFNKVKKEVIVLKDIKITTTKFVVGPINVPGIERTQESGLIIQFSNRGEWDLGPSSGANSFQSYVHLYRGDYALSTVYDSDYHLNPTLPASVYSSYGSQPGASGTYDLAQIISSDALYDGWAAFWPALSDWSVDAGRQDQWWKSLMAADTHTIDGVGGEPFRSPYLIGEWDFFLTETRSSVGGRYFDRQFRGVTVYGVSDLWDGNDVQYNSANTIDSEVRYQLDEVFNPWDLYAGIHMDTRRWVEFHNVTAAEKTAADTGTNLNIILTHRPVRYVSDWDTYCNFSERIMWGGALKYPARSSYYTGSDLSAYEPYELYVNATGYGNVTIRAASVPAAGTVIKILYSTNCTYSYTYSDIANYFGGSLSLGNNTLTVTNATKGTIVPSASINSTSWTDVFDVVQNISILYDEFMFVTNASAVPSASQILTGLDDLNITIDIKVPPEGGNITVYNSTYYGVAPISPVSNTQNFTFYGNMSVMYKVNPPDSLSAYAHEYVHVTGSILIRANHTLYSTGSAYGALANYTIAGAALTKEVMGRYEWVVVGNHSRAIDSVGAAMVSEAFKEKQVIADNGGLDMKDMWGTRIPYLLSNLGNATWRAGGPAWTSIYDSLGRLAYIDDWCTRYPVSSSSMITVAGPSANLFSEYFNEFSQAIQIYGITSGNLIDVIFAPTCWNTTVLSNYLGQYYYADGQFSPGNTSTGIGVITTYKDINGTVGFMIYGWSGDDTYYTCKWFQEYGAYYLQTENRGVTTLVVRLEYMNITAISSNPRPPYYTYDDHFPRVTILERLGTISEKTPHDP